jgi:hypothetical protein
MNKLFLVVYCGFIPGAWNTDVNKNLLSHRFFKRMLSRRKGQGSVVQNYKIYVIPDGVVNLNVISSVIPSKLRYIVTNVSVSPNETYEME